MIYSYIQLSSATEMWLKLLAIAIPAIVAFVTPLVTYRWLSGRLALYQNNLSKELETYKKDLNKEIESYKIQLQSEFNARTYEFQTRFSLLQQRKAEVIEKLFELLAKLYQDFQYWENWDTLSRKRFSNKEELYEKLYADYHNFTDYFDQKRIYLDEDIGRGVLEIVASMQDVLSFQNIFGQPPPPMTMPRIHAVMNILEIKFKKALDVQRLQTANPKQMLS